MVSNSFVWMIYEFSHQSSIIASFGESESGS